MFWWEKTEWPRIWIIWHFRWTQVDDLPWWKAYSLIDQNWNQKMFVNLTDYRICKEAIKLAVRNFCSISWLWEISINETQEWKDIYIMIELL